MDAHQIVITGLLIAVGLGFAWSVMRELHIHAMQKAQEDTARKLADHLGAVNRLIDKIAGDVLSSSNLSREQQVGLINFLRDIEARLTAALHDNREWMRMRNESPTSIFNTNSGPGGQTNQGGSVNGEQR